MGCIASAIFLLAFVVFNYSLLCRKAHYADGIHASFLTHMLEKPHTALAQLTRSLRSPQVCLWRLSEQFSVPTSILHSAVAFLKFRPLNASPLSHACTKPDLPPHRKEKGVDPSASLPLLTNLCLLSHPVPPVEEDRLPFLSSADLLGLRLGVTVF